MQTSVESSMAIGVPGQLADLGYNDIITRINSSMMLDLITVTAANLATTLTIDGTAFTVNSGAETKTTIELAALLVAAINAGSVAVTATDILDGTFYVRGDVHGTAFTAVGTTNCSVAHKVANNDTIPFGKLLTEDLWTSGGAMVQGAYLPMITTEISTAGLVAGVTVHTQALEQLSTALGYAANDSMSLLRKGHIYVAVEDAVTKGQQAYVRFTASGTYTIGSFRSDTDSGKAVALPSSRYTRAASAGGITILDLNLP